MQQVPPSKLFKSLNESLEAAKYCSGFRKQNTEWGMFSRKDCLLVPAGILLLSIIDTMGFYYRTNTKYPVLVDSVAETINEKGWEHFKVLNVWYFDQDLSATFLKVLYSKYTSLLNHDLNGIADVYIYPNNKSYKQLNIISKAFAKDKDGRGNYIYIGSPQKLVAWILTNDS